MVMSPATFLTMNPPITFPPPSPALKLARPSTEKWAATLAEERRRLHEDQEALREREANLREYESRLRALQAEIEAGRAPSSASLPPPASIASSSPRNTTIPFQDDPALQAAWEKLHRAREILEAEQNHLRDDRIAMRELQSTLKVREETVAEREARVAEREALITAALPREQAAAEHTMSAVTRLTRVPFDMARNVFGGKK